jgi:CRISPR-associated endonuclease Cas1
MKTKTIKIALEGYGSYLGMEKGCFTVKNREGNTRKYPLFENQIDEIRIKSGNSISSSALASCGFWGINCIFLTQKGRPVAMLRSLDDDSHVKTRIAQYEASKNEKAEYIARHLVLGKLKGQNQVLKKYGLKQHDYSVFEKVKNLKAENTETLRIKLMSIEGHFSEKYFNQIFSLIPYSLRPDRERPLKPMME